MTQRQKGLIGLALFFGIIAVVVAVRLATAAERPAETATPSMTTVTPTTTTFHTPEQSADEITAQYIAALKARGFTVTDEDDAFLAGSGFCGLIAQGEGLINATAGTMDIYDLTPEQAKQVAQAAAEAICPQYG